MSLNFVGNVAGALGVGVEIQVTLDGRDAMNAVLGRDASKYAGVGWHEYPHVGASLGRAEGQVAEVVESVLVVDVDAGGPERRVSAHAPRSGEPGGCVLRLVRLVRECLRELADEFVAVPGWDVPCDAVVLAEVVFVQPSAKQKVWVEDTDEVAVLADKPLVSEVADNAADVALVDAGSLRQLALRKVNGGVREQHPTDAGRHWGEGGRRAPAALETVRVALDSDEQAGGADVRVAGQVEPTARFLVTQRTPGGTHEGDGKHGNDFRRKARLTGSRDLGLDRPDGVVEGGGGRRDAALEREDGPSDEFRLRHGCQLAGIQKPLSMDFGGNLPCPVPWHSAIKRNGHEECEGILANQNCGLRIENVSNPSKLVSFRTP